MPSWALGCNCQLCSRQVCWFFIWRVKTNKLGSVAKDQSIDAQRQSDTDKEGEKVFTITNDHFAKALEKFPKIKEKVEIFIDWDEDNFNSSMSSSDILLAWNFPTSNLKKISPNLKWVHCISEVTDEE